MHNGGYSFVTKDVMGTIDEIQGETGFDDHDVSVQFPDFDGFFEVIKETVSVGITY